MLLNKKFYINIIPNDITFGDEDGIAFQDNENLSGSQNTLLTRRKINYARFRPTLLFSFVLTEQRNPTMATALPSFPAFDVHTDVHSLGLKWKKWIQRFENLLLALNITQVVRKRALLLHYAGEAVHDIFDTLADTGANDKYATAVTRLTEHFEPQRNLEFELYTFRQARQETDDHGPIPHTTSQIIRKL